MNSEILIYQNQEGTIKVDVRLEEERCKVVVRNFRTTTLHGAILGSKN